MGSLCTKEDWTFEPTEFNQIRHAEKPFMHPVVKLLIGKKIVKRRPVISTPRPVNPVHLRGRKWRHVIVTMPKIEEPPVRPVRRKRLKPKRNFEAVDATLLTTGQQIRRKPRSPSDTRLTLYTKALNAFCSLQLRRYLCLAKTAIFITRERNSSRMYRRDLYSIFSRLGANESLTTRKANAVSLILRNASLTNELPDTYFQRHDDANTNGFKNFLLLTAERDLDKLKFCKMCRQLELCRALPPPESTINDVIESGSIRLLDELTHRRAEDATNNTKTNQNHNTVAANHKSNIKKVWKRMKKNGRKLVTTKTNWKKVITEHSLFSPPTKQQVAGYQHHKMYSSEFETCPTVDDNDSDCSISDSLSDFSTSL